MTNARRVIMTPGTGSHALISGLRDRLPMPQPLCDQLGAFAIVASVQDAHVLGIGAQVNTGRPQLDFRVSVRMSCEVPGRAIGGFNLDPSRPLQLRRVRMPRPFSLPIVEDAGGGPSSPSPVPSTYWSDRLTPPAASIHDEAHRRVALPPPGPGSVAAHSATRARPSPAISVSGSYYSSRRTSTGSPADAPTNST